MNSLGGKGINKPVLCPDFITAISQPFAKPFPLPGAASTLSFRVSSLALGIPCRAYASALLRVPLAGHWDRAFPLLASGIIIQVPPAGIGTGHSLYILSSAFDFCSSGSARVRSSSAELLQRPVVYTSLA